MAFLAAAGGASALAAEPDSPSLERELTGISEKVANYRQSLGDRAGVPEVADAFTPIPRNAPWLTAEEARAGFKRALPRIKQLIWWRVGLDPMKLSHPLREPAAVISGCATVYQVKLDGGQEALALARNAAEFLLWAQGEAGTGGFPFPATRGVAGNAAFRASDGFLARAEQTGQLEASVHNGWVVDDAGDGGLQFDNAEAGVALLDLYSATQEKRYLDSARRAADWAIPRPIVRNWNYNSFSAYLLARFARATGEAGYLDAAVRKVRVGVLPGQLRDGPNAGRWVDQHNARPAYHYIMLRALAEVTGALPANDPARTEIIGALALGLRARNRDFTGPGAATKDKAMETLLSVHRVFAADQAFIHATLSDVALDALGRLVSEEFRRGKAPLGPREWAGFLAHVVTVPRPTVAPTAVRH